MFDWRNDKAHKLSSQEARVSDWLEVLQGLERDQNDFPVGADSVHRYFGTCIYQLHQLEKGSSAPSDTPFGRSLWVFRALYHIDYPNPDEQVTLLSMVGFSLEPVMHTLLTLRPQKITLFFSRESEKFDASINADEYINFLIGLYGAGYCPEIESIVLENTDTAFVFASVNRKIKESYSQGKVAIDVTGGKKSMDVSAFLAASLHEDVSIYYVDYEAYNSDGGYPIWGSEFLNRLANPYAFFSIREEHLVKELWNKGNYAAVKDLVASVTKESFTQETAERYLLEDRHERFVDIGKAAACYEAWSRFDYKDAQKNKFKGTEMHHGQVLDDLERCPLVFVEDRSCEEVNANLVLKLAVDRYKRGTDAARFKEWNRAALCYMQAVEAMLRFAYSISCDISFKKVKKHNPLDMLCDLFAFKRVKQRNENGDVIGVEYRYEPNELAPVFSGRDVFESLRDDVLFKRNELSHYECVVRNSEGLCGENFMISIMDQMESAVKGFLELFAEKYKIGKKEVDIFSRKVAFLQLDESSQFIKPE